MIDLTPLIQAIISVISLAVSAFLIPYLKRKINAAKLEEIQGWVKKAVEAAEVIFPDSGLGDSKLIYVKGFLESKGYTINEKELEVLIHSELHKMWLEENNSSSTN